LLAANDDDDETTTDGTFSLQACVFAFVPRMVFSAVFMLCSQLSHLHGELMHDGGGGRAGDGAGGGAGGHPAGTCMHSGGDWYRHQVKTSANYCTGSTLVFYFSGGLSHQIEHHLFPNVNHCHLPHIQPIVQRVCRKHGVDYREFSSIGEALRSYYRHITSLR